MLPKITDDQNYTGLPGKLSPAIKVVKITGLTPWIASETGLKSVAWRGFYWHVLTLNQ
jgi:hypothetical protein